MPLSFHVLSCFITRCRTALEHVILSQTWHGFPTLGFINWSWVDNGVLNTYHACRATFTLPSWEEEGWGWRWLCKQGTKHHTSELQLMFRVLSKNIFGYFCWTSVDKFQCSLVFMHTWVLSHIYLSIHPYRSVVSISHVSSCFLQNDNNNKKIDTLRFLVYLSV